MENDGEDHAARVVLAWSTLFHSLPPIHSIAQMRIRHLLAGPMQHFTALLYRALS